MSLRRHARTGLCLLAGIFLLASVAPRARAQTAEQIEVARRHFQQGIDLYHAGRFADAIPEFEAALRVKSSPGLLFDLAQCNRQIGENDRALYLYQRVVKEFPDSKEAPEARTWIVQLGGSVGPAAPPASAASAPAKAPAWSPGALPTAPAAGATPSASSEGEETGPPLYTRWWFYAGVGAGVVAVAVTVGLLAASAGPSANIPPTPLGNQGIF